MARAEFPILKEGSLRPAQSAPAFSGYRAFILGWMRKERRSRIEIPQIARVSQNRGFVLYVAEIPARPALGFSGGE